MEQLLSNANIILCKATYHRDSIENVMSILLAFEQELNKIKKKDIPEFIQKYGCMLSSIQYNLYTLISDPNNATHKPDLLNSRNRIFFSKLPSIQPEIVMRKVTDIFHDFIKGITWFDNEHTYSPKEPAYHRPGSCPANGQNNPTCTKGNNINANVIEKCYIERLIYNAIWQKIMMFPQDKQHNDWLENTRKAYNTCFPNTNIEATLGYSNKKYIEHIPEVLSVTKTNNLIFTKDECIYTKEYLYNRRMYVFPVDCVKHVGTMIYKKKNYYVEDSIWKAVNTQNDAKMYATA